MAQELTLFNVLPVTKQQEQTAEEKIVALSEEIRKHDRLYEMNQPIITDSEYDQLYAQLVELEAKYPQYRKADSPTQRITAVLVDSLEKVTHSTPMLSLDKVTTVDGILKFCRLGRGWVLAQQKLDGLTVVLTYENGRLTQAVTRGTGYVGESILHSASQISNVPQAIPFKNHLEIRCEVIIPFNEFERANVDGKYSNPRNLASGTLRQLDARIAKGRGLKAYVLELVEAEGMEFEFDTECNYFLDSLGFEMVDSRLFQMPNEMDDMLRYINNYNDTIRPNLPHMIDGLVLKFNDLALREELGFTSKFPKWAIAYKFSSQDAVTTLKDIVLQVGKTAQITPVAEFESIEIDGVNISRATLHNFGNIQGKDIRVGDQILVARANDVIPQVIKSFPEQRQGKLPIFEVPPVCPECGAPVEYRGEHLYCTGSNCEPQIVGKLEHFVSRNAMTIDGLGEKTVAMLYEKGFVKNFSDIYDLAKHEFAITNLDGFGQKKFDKMIAGIEASKKQPLENVLYSLSINLIGETASKAIAKVYDSMDAILEAAQSPFMLQNTLLSIHDFGEKMAVEFVDYFSNADNINVIQALRAKGLEMRSAYQAPAADSPVTGKIFVITGKLSKDRKLFKQEIEALGGKVSGSVSKKTHYLLMGPDAEGTTKHQDAIKQGVTVLSESDYLALIGN